MKTKLEITKYISFKTNEDDYNFVESFVENNSNVSLLLHMHNLAGPDGILFLKCDDSEKGFIIILPKK